MIYKKREESKITKIWGLKKQVNDGKSFAETGKFGGEVLIGLQNQSFFSDMSNLRRS